MASRTPRRTEGAAQAARQQRAPCSRMIREQGARCVGCYFLPWFFTASMAAFAASGSRYVPPGFNGRKFSSSS